MRQNSYSDTVHLLILFVSLSWLSGCVPEAKEAKQAEAYTYKTEIVDSLAVQSIREYIMANKVDDKQSVVFLTITRSNERTNYYINHSSNSIDSFSQKPSFFALVDSTIVLLYSGLEPAIADRNVFSEVKRYMAEHGHKRIDQYILEHSLTWRVMDCQGDVTKEVDNYFFDDIPCGYSIEMDDDKAFHLTKNK